MQKNMKFVFCCHQNVDILLLWPEIRRQYDERKNDGTRNKNDDKNEEHTVGCQYNIGKSSSDKIVTEATQQQQ